MESKSHNIIINFFNNTEFQRNTQKNTKVISSIIASELDQYCQCNVTENYIQSIALLPCVNNERSVAINITLTLIKDYTNDKISSFLKEWADTLSTIKLDANLTLSVESVCNSSECLLHSTTTQIVVLSITNSIEESKGSSSQLPITLSVAVPTVAVTLILFVGIFIAIYAIMKRKRTRFVCNSIIIVLII